MPLVPSIERVSSFPHCKLDHLDLPSRTSHLFHAVTCWNGRPDTASGPSSGMDPGYASPTTESALCGFIPSLALQEPYKCRAY